MLAQSSLRNPVDRLETDLYYEICDHGRFVYVSDGVWKETISFDTEHHGGVHGGHYKDVLGLFRTELGADLVAYRSTTPARRIYRALLGQQARDRRFVWFSQRTPVATWCTKPSPSSIASSRWVKMNVLVK